MNIFRQNIRAWVEYGDGVNIPIQRMEITSVVVTYGLREIPVATLQIGHGRDILTSKKFPDANESLAPDIPAKVWCRLTGNRTDVDRWDGVDRLIFDGFITSIAASRISNNTTGTYMVQHWSSSLTGASLLASYTYPGNSVELMLPAYIRRVANAGVGADQTGTLYSLLDQAIIYPNNVQVNNEDIWADIAKPFLIRVSKQNPFADFARFASCFPNAGGDNDEALATLARFEGETNTDQLYKPYNLPRDKWGVPVRLADAANSDLRKSVLAVLTRPVIATLMQHTAWSYIIENMCTDFGLYLVPGIERCRVVPIAPTLNRVFKELDPNSCVVLDCNRPIDHYLKATTMSAADITTAGQAIAQPGQIHAFGPCYSPPAAGDKGLVLPVMPPKWLRHAKFSAFDPAQTSRVLDGIAGGVFAAADRVKAQDVEAARKVEAIRNDVNKYGQAWVKSLYAEAVTITRVMKLVSYLRFDIGPGSQVAVTDSRGVPGFGDKVYGMVSKVTIMLDSTRPMAATTFQVANLRDENENRLDFLGVEQHPLFNDVFVGAPLSETFE